MRCTLAGVKVVVVGAGQNLAYLNRKPFVPTDLPTVYSSVPVT